MKSRCASKKKLTCVQYGFEILIDIIGTIKKWGQMFEPCFKFSWWHIVFELLQSKRCYSVPHELLFINPHLNGVTAGKNSKTHAAIRGVFHSTQCNGSFCSWYIYFIYWFSPFLIFGKSKIILVSNDPLFHRISLCETQSTLHSIVCRGHLESIDVLVVALV